MKSAPLTVFLTKAFQVRAALFSEMQEALTTSYRFFSGDQEGIPGLTIEVFGEVGIFQVFEGRCMLPEPELKELAQWCGTHLKVRAVYLKHFIPDRSHAKEDPALKSSIPLWGTEAPEEFPILENGIRYLIRPYDGYSVGLFLDQRNNRHAIAEFSQEKEVLNLFSYTCGFSVACAKKGGRVTSVDVSKKYLEWGKRNFRENGLPLQSHHFILSDSMEYLKRAQKRGISFDVVILDPPSFGRSAEGVFSLKKDWKELFTLSLQVLKKDGILFFSSNLSLWASSQFRNNVRDLFKGQKPFIEIPIKKPLDFSFEIQGLHQICLKI